MPDITTVSLAETKLFGNLSAEFYNNVRKEVRDFFAVMTEAELDEAEARLSAEIAVFAKSFPEIANAAARNVSGGFSLNDGIVEGRRWVPGFGKRARAAIAHEILSALISASKDEAEHLESLLGILKKYSEPRTR